MSHDPLCVTLCHFPASLTMPWWLQHLVMWCHCCCWCNHIFLVSVIYCVFHDLLHVREKNIYEKRFMKQRENFKLNNVVKFNCFIAYVLFKILKFSLMWILWFLVLYIVLMFSFNSNLIKLQQPQRFTEIIFFIFISFGFTDTKNKTYSTLFLRMILCVKDETSWTCASQWDSKSNL